MKSQKSEVKNKWSVVSGQWSAARNLSFLLLLFTVHCSLFTVLTGCQQQGAPPQPPAAQVKKEALQHEAAPLVAETEKKEEKSPPKADEVKPPRNPFKTFIVKATERPSVVAPKTPLQRYELEQLKLVAIIWGINSPVAMIEAPDGKGYKIKKGDLVGSREGRVKRIEKDRVIVEERFTEANGEVVINEFEIKLPLPKEEEELR